MLLDPIRQRPVGDFCNPVALSGWCISADYHPRGQQMDLRWPQRTERHLVSFRRVMIRLAQSDRHSMHLVVEASYPDLKDVDHTATVSPIWQSPTPCLSQSTWPPSPSTPPPHQMPLLSAASRHRLGGSRTSSYCPLIPPLNVP